MGAAFAERHRAIGADVETLKHHVYVLSIETSEDLWDTVDSRLPAFIAQQMKDPTGMEVRLLVIDSLGALLRAWETHPQADAATSAKERARYVQKLAARLKQISAAFKVAVVVLNQVADKPFDEAQRRAAAPWERGPCATPDGMGARVPARRRMGELRQHAARADARGDGRRGGGCAAPAERLAARASRRVVAAPRRAQRALRARRARPRRRDAR